MKSALVTGSAKRLGRSIVLKLAEAGYFVWIHYLNSKTEAEATLEEVRQKGGEGSLVQGDVGDKKQVASLCNQIKEDSRSSLEVLVNNVGEYLVGPLENYPIEYFERSIQTNLLGSYYMIQHCLPLFSRQGGAIVNIGYAGIENITAAPHNTAYVISKSGLLTLTKSYAVSLAARQIRVNMVSPGLLSNTIEGPESPGELIPAGRFGECEEVADAVLFLCGEKSSYITGVNLDVAGGYMLAPKTYEP